MTRMIDADALSEKLCETTIFIKGGEMFQRMINNAPTIEPDGDTISRRDALAEFRDGRDVYDIMESIEELPSAPDSRQRGVWVTTAEDRHVFTDKFQEDIRENIFGGADIRQGGEDE